MSDHALLGRDSVDLLLSLLEAEEPVITGSAAELVYPVASPLIARQLLVEAGYDDVVGIDDDGNEALVSLFPIRDDGALGHADRHVGFAEVPRERLLRRRVNIVGMLREMMTEMDLPLGWRPISLIDGMVWEIPDASIASGRRSLWFARRLVANDTTARLADMVRRRPQPAPLLILTSTPAHWLAGRQQPEGAIVISVRDVLRTPDQLTIHAEIVERRLLGIQTPYDPAVPVWLSVDGTELRFACGTSLSFSGPVQIAVLKKLKAAYDRGKAVRVKELTSHGGIAKVFGAERWRKLEPFLKQRPDGWTFRG
jgi:hypothetical protein